MKILSLFLVLLATSAFAADKTAEKVFGKMEPQSAAQTTLSDATKNFEKYKGQPIALTGTVKKVCQSSGCWFELSQGEQVVRITMKDYGFTVPKDILNKSVKVVGVMESKTLPVKVVRHYMKDEGRPQSEIDKVNEPQKTFEFVANGVSTL
jgi:Domain of unknown function (DUF4920)